MDFDSYFINLAKSVSLKSKDPSTKYGAVIVSDTNAIVSTGYNSFPRNYPDDKILTGELAYRLLRPEKYYWVEHAERNSIFNASRHGIKLEGCSMYTNAGMPCVDCARAIIQSGIVAIHYRTDIEMTSRWIKHAPRSEELFRECGVVLNGYIEQDTGEQQ